MSEPQWLNEDEMRLFRAFLAASSGITSRLDTLLKASSGIALDDYEVLVHLSESPDHRLRMSELSDQILHSRSRLTQRIDRLVRRGLVEREKCETDARGTWAVLTADGFDALRDAAPHHVEHVRENLLAHISEEEVPIIVPILERLTGGVRPSS